MKKLTLISLLVLLIMLFCSCGSVNQPTDTNLLKNSGFETETGSAVTDWVLERYNTKSPLENFAVVEADDAPEGKNVLKIDNVNFNDARFVQKVSLMPNSTYCFSAMVKTEMIAGLYSSDTGANLSFIQTYCKSEFIKENTPWTRITVYGSTDKDTKSSTVALRLGYYSADCKGTAYFDDVSLTRVDSVPEGAQVISLTPFEFASSEENDETKSTISKIESSVLIRGILYFALLGVFMFLAIKKRFITFNVATIIIAVSLVIRLIASVSYVGFDVDVNCFAAWGNKMASAGPADFYSEGYFCDYPPLYMFVLGFISLITGSLNLTEGIGLMILKSPAIICDIISAVLIIKITKKYVGENVAAALGVLYALLPTAIINSALWGQVDSILVVFMLLAFYLIEKDKMGVSIIVFAIGLLFKPQAVLFGPIMLFAVAREFITIFRGIKTDKRDSMLRLAKGFGGLFVSIGLFLALSLIMRNGQGPTWLVDKYLTTIGGQYNYATLSSFGLMGLLQGQWVKEDSAVLGEITYSQLGTACIILVFALCAFIFLFALFKAKKETLSAKWLWLLAGLFLAGMVVFSTRTHERYLFPAIFALFVAFAHFKDVRLLIVGGAYAFINFINTACVLYIYSDLKTYMDKADPFFLIFSGLTVIAFIYHAFVSVSLLFTKQERQSLLEEKDETVEAEGEAKASQDKKLKKLFARKDFAIKRVTLKDVIICLLITAIYACVAFTNLGNTESAQSFWHSSSGSATATFDLGSVKEFDSIAYYPDSYDGEFDVLISLDGENYKKYTSCALNSDKEGIWNVSGGKAEARYVKLNVLSALSLNEFAVLKDGAPVEIQSVTQQVLPADAKVNPNNLIDEQDSFTLDIVHEKELVPWSDGGEFIVEFASPAVITEVLANVSYSEGGDGVTVFAPTDKMPQSTSKEEWTGLVSVTAYSGFDGWTNGEFIYFSEDLIPTSRVLVSGVDSMALRSLAFMQEEERIEVARVFDVNGEELSASSSVYSCFADSRLLETHLNDENASFWKISSCSDYVIADFGEITDVERGYYFTSVCQGAFTVYLSQDGQDWHKLRSYSVEPGNLYYWHKMEFNEIKQARYVMVCADSSYMKLIEMGFFTSEDATEPIKIKDVYASSQSELSGKLLFDEQHLVPSEGATYMNSMYFDEIYHARTAYESLNGLSIYEWTHPPLGKDMMSWCISLMGMTPFAWRFAGTLAGVLMLPAIFFLALLLFRKTSWATVATLLMALDGMHFVQTRIATIDSYGVLFIILMFLFMYWYYSISFYDMPLWKTFIPLGLCGLSFGLGAASKWICLYAGAGLAVIFFITLFRRGSEYFTALKCYDKTEGEEKAYLNRIIKVFPKNTILTLLFCIGVFIIIPAIIYCASYYPYFNAEGETRHWLEIILDNQKDMFSYHSKLQATHNYQSDWYTWPVMYLPMFFYAGPSDATNMACIYSFGNPAVWYSGLVCTLVGLGLCIKRYLGYSSKLETASATGMLAWFAPGDEKLTDKKERDTRLLLFLALGLACNLLPWVGISRCIFIYHYFASVPFIILFTVYCLRHAWRKYPKASTYITVGLIVFALILFIMFKPVWTGTSVSRDYVNDFLRWLPSWFAAWFR
ncbi:MAG: discoidin domain-containing protein [Clostridia bacterium]|nr:discoidin domain-containing protein [Clostridia bacterium]